MRRIFEKMGLLAAAAALVAPAAAQACEREGAVPSKLSVKQARKAVICLINQRRHGHGVAGLSPDPRLARAAQRHSKSMDRGNFFSHTGPGGSSPESRVRRSGYMAGASAWGVAENIRWGRGGNGSPKAIVASWMQSPAHRAALLSGRYRHVGVGMDHGSPSGRGRNAAIYTATFGYRG